MNIKRFFKFERNIQMDFPYSYHEFETEFKRRYENAKKPEFEGYIDNQKFKLEIVRGFSNITDFTELIGTIERIENKNIIIAKIELSVYISAMFFLGLFIFPLIGIYKLIKDYSFDFILFSIFFVTAYFFMINLQLYKDKNKYKEEFNNIIRDLKIKKTKKQIEN